MPGQRDVTYRPHPMFGLPGGLNIADLPRSYSSAIVILDAVTTDPSTSAEFTPTGAEGFEVVVETDGITVDVSILDAADDSLVTKVTAARHGQQFMVSWLEQRIDVRGKSFKVKVENFSVAGTVTVKYNPQ